MVLIHRRLTAYRNKRNRGQRAMHAGGHHSACEEEDGEGGSESDGGQQGIHGSHGETHEFYAARCARGMSSSPTVFLNGHKYPVDNLNLA